MVKKYILVIVIFATFLCSSAILKYGKEITAYEVKQVFSNEVFEDTKLKETKEETEIYTIKIYYPETKYKNLNEYINFNIKQVKESFLEETNSLGKFTDNCKYELNITFNQYKYKSYISFAFDVSIDLCGAHPYNYIFTAIYNTDTDKVITIKDLLKLDKEFLNKLSDKTYEILKNNTAIKEYSNEESLKKGLMPSVSNFENIIFDSDKLIVFINIYQVAPYVAGNFEVAIPYNEIL